MQKAQKCPNLFGGGKVQGYGHTVFQKTDELILRSNDKMIEYPLYCLLKIKNLCPKIMKQIKFGSTFITCILYSALPNS